MFLEQDNPAFSYFPIKVQRGKYQTQKRLPHFSYIADIIGPIRLHCYIVATIQGQTNLFIKITEKIYWESYRELHVERKIFYECNGLKRIKKLAESIDLIKLRKLTEESIIERIRSGRFKQIGYYGPKEFK